MQFNVEINPDEVNKQVSEAIINSALGEKLKAAINKRMDDILGGGWNDPGIVKTVVDEEVRNIIRTMLQSDEFQTQMQAVVRKWFEEKFSDALIGDALDRLWDKLFER